MVAPPQFHDLREHDERLRRDLQAAVTRVLAGGQYILGPQVERFERTFAASLGLEHGIGVASGTDAVRIALQAAGVRSGDTVVTTANAGVPPVAAIVALGARPLFVDVEPDTLQISARQLAAVEDASVRAVVVVHLYGGAAEIPDLVAIAHRRGWRVVEDCAHALGTRYRGASVGSFGDAAAFSFYPTKNLGAAGDAGFVATPDPEVAERARGLRCYGWDHLRVSQVPATHSRMDELQAAVLLAKFPYLEQWNERRRMLAARYGAALPPDLGRVHSPPWVQHAHHLFVVRAPRREVLRRHLEAHGIETRIHYAPAVYEHPAYRSYAPSQPLPVTSSAAHEVLSLPIYPALAEAQVDLVARLVADCPAA